MNGIDRAARARCGSGSSRPGSSTPTGASSAGPAWPSARRTPSASTRTPTCPSWSRCAPAARCAGTSAPGAGCATRPCGRPRPRRATRTARCSRPRCAPTRPTPTGRSPAAPRRRAGRRRRLLRGAGRAHGPTTPRTAAWSRALLIGAAGRRARSTARWSPSRAPTPTSRGRASPTIATTAKEIVEAASGSFYNQTMALAELDLSQVRPAGQAADRRGRHARARSRACGPCRPAAGRPGRTGSTRWC